MSAKAYLTPIKAIRAKCMDCTAGQPGEIRDCIIRECPLYPFRMGRNPNRAGIGPAGAGSRRKHELSAVDFGKNHTPGAGSEGGVRGGSS